MREFSVRASILGVVLGVLFGAANVYLALQVGLTVSASIPVAVVSMAVLRGLLRGGTVLENNMVQTIGSAGESLAAGVVFTIPALYIWGQEPDLLEVFLLSLLGGLLGVLFMVPLRRRLIVEEHETLPYPEGTACAEVLLAGEKGGELARKVFAGLAVGAVYKIASGVLRLFSEAAALPMRVLRLPPLEADLLPALFGIGYIVGLRIAAIMAAGGALGWLVLVPLVQFFGAGFDEPVFPSKLNLIRFMSAYEVRSLYVRYIGAGAVAMGGLISLVKVAPTIVRSLVGAFKPVQAKLERTEQDLPIKYVVLGVVLLFLGIWFAPFIPVGFLGSLLIVVFSFFFTTVSSRIVGLIGSSSNPASGMTIATLLATTLILSAAGYSGDSGKTAALFCGAVVCIAIAIAGDTSQDLKTGFLVGATPWKQQLGELLGVATAAAFVGLTLFVLSRGYGIGPSEERMTDAQRAAVFAEGFAPDERTRLCKAELDSFLEAHPHLKSKFVGTDLIEVCKVSPAKFARKRGWLAEKERLQAPQATLMAMVIDGVMDQELPWGLIIVGMVIAVVVELLSVPALPFAVGLYLPFSLSFTVLLGGIAAWLIDRGSEQRRQRGILLASGLIAGEALVGVFTALLRWQGVDLTVELPAWVYEPLAVMAFAAMAVWFAVSVRRGSNT